MELVLQYTQLQTVLPYRISDLDIIPTKVTLCPHHVGHGIVEMQLHGFLSLTLDTYEWSFSQLGTGGLILTL